MELTEPEKAWLACAIDGEGSIAPSLGWYNGKPSFHPRILVFNTKLPFINEAERLLGTNMSTQKISVTTNKKVEYQAGLADHKEVISILEQIFPYLIINKEKAEVAIDWCKHRIEYYNMPYDTIDYCYYLILKSLNSRQGKTIKEIGDEFILKILAKCTNPSKYLNLVIEAMKSLEM